MTFKATTSVKALAASLKGRLLLASLLVLPLVCASFAWSLNKSFYANLLQNQERQMTLQAYALMASAELSESGLHLPQYLNDDRLNQTSSGASAFVFSGKTQRLLWQSTSALRATTLPDAQAMPLGQAIFERLVDQAGPELDVFRLSYLVEWEDERGGALPFVFVLTDAATALETQAEDYRRTLYVWLALITALLLVFQLLVLWWGLKPLDQVISDLWQVQNGQREHLAGAYPRELKALTNSINDLIKHEQRQRDKHRNALADLAHSLKNPVAIIQAALPQLRQQKQGSAPRLGQADEQASSNTLALKDVNEQCQRIDDIVSYQLRRAVGQGSTPFMQSIKLAPLLEKIASAMRKVYQHKGITLTLDVPADITLKGDEGDVMELFGNLIDNACKYGKQQVSVLIKTAAIKGASSATQKPTSEQNSLLIVIEDDGPGISEALQTQLSQRGRRADTSEPGQGIGLAVVADIVEHYHGHLAMHESDMGGLQIQLSFPQA